MSLRSASATAGWGSPAGAIDLEEAARLKSMYTICPKCALTLLVTAGDLRVAQGYVRCGRCSSVFNALARLTEERQEPEVEPESAPPPQPWPEETAAQAPPPAAATRRSAESGTPPPPPTPPAHVSDEEAIPDDALEFDPSRTDVTSVFVEPPPSPQWSAATGTFRAMMAANQEAMQAEAERQAREPSREADEPAPAPPRQSHEATRPRPADVPASPLEMVSAQQEAARARRPAPDAPHESAHTKDADSDADADIDVELGPEQLASILRADTPAELLREASPQPTASAPAPAPTPRAPAAPLRTSRQRSRVRTREREAPPSAAAAPESAPQKPPAPPPPPAPVAPIPAAPPTPSAPEAAGEPVPYRQRVLRAVRLVEGEWLISLAWSAGAVVAALLLLAQIVNHYRDVLAASPSFNRPLTALYGALGVPLVPRWDVKAYDVRQLGASVEPGGAGLITVRASVKNGAAQPQPLPLLRVTLQDRFGNRIAARDVAPQSYLSHSAPALLSAGERIDAEMGFVDPGANAVGFEIDACLPTGDGAVTCANDTAAR